MKSSIQTFIKQHAFLVFVGLTFLISWLPWYSGGTGLLVFGPSIAGVIIIALTGGKTGLHDLGLRALRWRVGLRWWAVAIFLPALILLVSLGIDLILGGELPGFAFFRQEWRLAPLFFLITIVGGPLGEEFGWRGFALPHLQRRWSPLMASLIIGVVWGLWHLPTFFEPGSLHNQLGLQSLPLFVLGEIVLATFITWVYNATEGSLLVGGIILHNADNFWSTLLLTDVTMSTALHGGAPPQIDMSLYLTSIVVGILVVLVLAVATHGNLGLSKETTTAKHAPQKKKTFMPPPSATGGEK